MRFLTRFLRLCAVVLCLLASVVQAGTAYEVRYWKRGAVTLYGCAYTSASDVVAKMQADGWVLTDITFTTSIQNTSIMRCPYFIDGVNHHWAGTFSSDGACKVLYNDGLKACICYPNWYDSNNYKTFDQYLGYKLQVCSSCNGGTSWGYDEFSVGLVTVNTDAMPIWGWGKLPPGVASVTPVWSADGTQVTSFNSTFNDLMYPEGAVLTGEGANGSVQFDATTPPHWVWTPGMEPGAGEGGGDTSSADAAAIKASVDVVAGKVQAASDAAAAAASTLNDSVQALKAQATTAAAQAATAAAEYKASIDAFRTASLAQTASEAAANRAAIAAAQSAAAADAAALRSGLGSDIAALKAQAASDAAASRSAAASASASQVATLEALRAAQAASAVEASTAAAAAQTAAAEAKAQATLDADRVVNAINSAKAQAASDAAAAQAATAAASVAHIAAVEASKVQAAADAAAARSAAAAAVAGANADLMGFKVQAATDAAAARTAAAAFSAAQIAASDAFKAQAAADAAAARSAAAYDALSIKNAIIEKTETPLDLSPVVNELTAIKLAVTGNIDSSDVDGPPEADADLDAAKANAAAFKANTETTLNKLNDSVRSTRAGQKATVGHVRSFMGSLTGQWSTLGRVPLSDWVCSIWVGTFHVYYELKFSKADFLAMQTRAIEVVMLWVYFAYRLMGLYSASVKVGKGES